MLEDAISIEKAFSDLYAKSKDDKEYLNRELRITNAEILLLILQTL